MAEERPATLEEIITGLAKQQGVSPSLALAVAKKESGMDLNVPPGDGGQAILVAPGWLSWWWGGRQGITIEVTYTSGWPHTSLTAAAAVIRARFRRGSRR